MPRFRLGDRIVRRKHNWLPCAVAARTDEMTDEEYAAVLKANKWADRITDAEWRALLQHDDCSPFARSRLKAKGAEWLIALARIYQLNPDLFAEIASKAEAHYEEQIARHVVRLAVGSHDRDGRVLRPRLASRSSAAVWTEDRQEATDAT